MQDLVNHVLGAGVWLDQQQANRDKAVQIAAGRQYFNQDPKIIRFVMENPTDRVTYGDLRMIRAEFEELMQLSMEAGTIKHPIAVREVRGRALRARRAARRSSRYERRRLAHCIAGCSLLFAAAAAGGRRSRRSRPASSARRDRRRSSRCRDPTAASSS